MNFINNPSQPVTPTIRFPSLGIQEGNIGLTVSGPPSLATGLQTQPASPRFGFLRYALSPITRTMGTSLEWVQADRIRELTIEDLFGFGVSRTFMDLYRGYFFGSNKINWIAGRERLLREGFSIATDIFLPGLAALGIGALFDRGGRAFSNKFLSFDSMYLFQDLSKKATSTPGLRNELASLIANGGKHTPAIRKAMDKLFETLADTGKTQAYYKKLAATMPSIGTKPRKFGPSHIIEDVATDIAKMLGNNHFDITLKGQSYTMDGLLKDLHVFQQVMADKKHLHLGVNWQERAEKLIANTLKAKRWKLPCMALGFLATAAVPFFNKWLTWYLDSMTTYPGEIGLTSKRHRESKPLSVLLNNTLKHPRIFTPLELDMTALPEGMEAKTKANVNAIPMDRDSAFPYLKHELKRGNPWPVIITVATLPFALGFFNSLTRRFVNPFKTGFKGFVRYLEKNYDFHKTFPFTGQQQIASFYALLIGSRLACARSDNEFRERVVDSGISWFAWILGTPLAKAAISKAWSKPGQVELLKSGGALRSRTEIEKFLTKGVRDLTMSKQIQLSFWSTIITILMLGVVEPWGAILWTKARGLSDENG